MTVQSAALSSRILDEKRRRVIRWSLVTAACILFLWLLCRALSPWIRLGINGTESLPGSLYLIFKNDIPAARGELIAFYPPHNRYYPPGMFFIKRVMGLPGDRVRRTGSTFYLNGRIVATAKTRSRFGDPLQPGPTGVIPDGQYFVWTPHPDSYDSRYEDIGWISKDRVIGRAVRLF